MKTEYDISTKEKEISYLDIVDDILYTQLGLKPANGGTKYLRDLIIYIYNKNEYDYIIDKELKMFIKEKNIKKNPKTIKSKMVYAINNSRREKIEKNFYYVFKTDYDSYYLSIKNVVNASIIILKNANLKNTN